mmetsp:Transcript_5755/g.21777  ORF Transcript_5755/g.21777 Transcript_5755/m.21777 type:complete len:187 (-) Transcript_5755:1462-2022(-)
MDQEYISPVYNEDKIKEILKIQKAYKELGVDKKAFIVCDDMLGQINFNSPLWTEIIARRENSQILTYSSQKNTGSNFSCTIRRPLHAFAYSIKKVIIPYSWYPVSSQKKNTTFRITDSTSTAYNVTITAGSYTNSELATQLQIQLNNLASTDTFTVTFDGKTGKFTVTEDNDNFQINWTHANTEFL